MAASMSKSPTGLPPVIVNADVVSEFRQSLINTYGGRVGEELDVLLSQFLPEGEAVSLADLRSAADWLASAIEDVQSGSDRGILENMYQAVEAEIVSISTDDVSAPFPVGLGEGATPRVMDAAEVAGAVADTKEGFPPDAALQNDPRVRALATMSDIVERAERARDAGDAAAFNQALADLNEALFDYRLFYGGDVGALADIAPYEEDLVQLTSVPGNGGGIMVVEGGYGVPEGAGQGEGPYVPDGFEAEPASPAAAEDAYFGFQASDYQEPSPETEPDAGGPFVPYWQPEDDDHRYIEDVLPAAGRFTGGRRTPEEAAPAYLTGYDSGDAPGAGTTRWSNPGLAKSGASGGDPAAVYRPRGAARTSGRQRISWAAPMTLADVMANGHALGVNSAIATTLDAAYAATAPRPVLRGRQGGAVPNPVAPPVLKPSRDSAAPPNGGGQGSRRGGFSGRPASAVYDDGGAAGYYDEPYYDDPGAGDGSAGPAIDKSGKVYGGAAAAAAAAGNADDVVLSTDETGKMPPDKGQPDSRSRPPARPTGPRERTGAPVDSLTTPRSFGRFGHTMDKATHPAGMAQLPRGPLDVDAYQPALARVPPLGSGVSVEDTGFIKPTLPASVVPSGRRNKMAAPNEPTDIDTTAALIAQRNAQKRPQTAEQLKATAALPLTDDLSTEEWMRRRNAQVRMKQRSGTSAYSTVDSYGSANVAKKATSTTSRAATTSKK